ncbi:OLC1v1019644C1 [Oldenlandia corymbosa var. corymbosa]|uniref:OLC1v1019644C1 n=1 Tax=Oldenlandia corymbosa var. corymbosa TaxID=529605 RepID=A0AAV1EEK3_OLDCO|nr:OLC1v1019644C1 [Oldenlandia corymbosa var. corymbosa]
MVKSCGGLPLAVVVLGGVLATKKSYREWAVVDEEIDVERVIHWWTAEGMVLAEDKIGDESIMDVAERYFEQLGMRCLVMLRTFDVDAVSVIRYRSCRLHDLMRDLCRAKAREENFLRVIGLAHANDNQLADSFPSSGRSIRRVMINLSDKDAAKYAPIQLVEGKHLRTMEFWAVGTEHSYFTQQIAQSQIDRFEMLKSLTIRHVTSPGVYYGGSRISRRAFKLPIGNLIHLRCLRSIDSLLVMSPSSISNLQHLETLDIRESHIVLTKKAPIVVRRLRHLYFTEREGGVFFPLRLKVSKELEIISGLQPPLIQIEQLSELSGIRKLVVTKECDLPCFADVAVCVKV